MEWHLLRDFTSSGRWTPASLLRELQRHNRTPPENYWKNSKWWGYLTKIIFLLCHHQIRCINCSSMGCCNTQYILWAEILPLALVVGNKVTPSPIQRTELSITNEHVSQPLITRKWLLCIRKSASLSSFALFCSKWPSFPSSYYSSQ